jgi:hypothetical protein
MGLCTNTQMARRTNINSRWLIHQNLCPKATTGKNVTLRHISLLLKYYEGTVVFCVGLFFQNFVYVCQRIEQ